MLAGRGREHLRLARARLLSARLAPGVCGPAVAGRVWCASSRTRPCEPLGPDEQGLVLVKGPNVMRGYLGRDDLTRAAFRDGWYVTATRVS